MDKDEKLLGERYEYVDDYQADLEAHDRYIEEFDANEAMFISKTYDQVSKKTKNGITDSAAATMLIERSARVVGQLPTGVTEAAGKKDRGKGALMDIIRQKYIYPNANAQRPLLDKFRLWETYSGVYGNMLVFYDWNVAPSGYIGPDVWLWNPRNFIPQEGKYTIGDMDYAHAISWLTKRDIKDLIETWDEESGWDKKALENILEAVESSSKETDQKRSTYTERTRHDDAIRNRVQIVTRFEAGDEGQWITFAPDFGCTNIRKIDNPHKNGKIPFLGKLSIPLLDSFYGLAELSRAKPLQFAKDGLTNFYFQGIKQNIYPPTVVNSQGILKHTVSNEPGSIWEEIIPNSARRLETSTAGLATYQAAMGQMSGALQNVFGTTTTEHNAESSMSAAFGKTPEAIRAQSARESARDNQNRQALQSAIEELIDAFYELIVNIGTEQIPIDLFAEDIAAIQNAGMTDVEEMLVANESGMSARLVINPKSLRGVAYRFHMKADSTVLQDKQQQKQDLLELIEVLGRHQNELQDIQKTSGKRINWEQIFNTFAELVDIPGLSEVFIDGEIPPAEDPALLLIEKLDIGFEDLPEDAKQAVLASVGIETQMPSPAAEEAELKHMETRARILDMAREDLKEENNNESKPTPK